MLQPHLVPGPKAQCWAPSLESVAVAASAGVLGVPRTPREGTLLRCLSWRQRWSWLAASLLFGASADCIEVGHPKGVRHVLSLVPGKLPAFLAGPKGISGGNAVLRAQHPNFAAVLSLVAKRLLGPGRRLMSFSPSMHPSLRERGHRSGRLGQSVPWLFPMNRSGALARRFGHSRPVTGEHARSLRGLAMGAGTCGADVRMPPKAQWWCATVGHRRRFRGKTLRRCLNWPSWMLQQIPVQRTVVAMFLHPNPQQF